MKEDLDLKRGHNFTNAFQSDSKATSEKKFRGKLVNHGDTRQQQYQYVMNDIPLLK